MSLPENSTEVARLYREFSDSFAANDHEAVRRIYRELLCLGRPRAEILDHSVRLASNNQNGPSEPAGKEPSVRRNAMEPSSGSDEIAPLQALEQPGSDVVRGGSGAARSIPESPTQKIGETSIGAGVETTSGEIFDEGGERGLGESDISNSNSNTEPARVIEFLLRSPIVPPSAAFGVIALALIAALVILPALGPGPIGSLASPSSSGPGKSASVSAVTSAETATALSDRDVTALLARGDSLLEKGDIVSARLFYERAANTGNGEAALRLGGTYDPQFLDQAHLNGVRGDVARAVFWYRRASDLGLRETEVLLDSLPSR